MTARPWSVPVTSLRRAVGTQHAVRRSGPLGELRGADTVVAAVALSTVDVVVSVVVGGIEAAGTVSSSWRAQCRRCLRPIGGSIDVPVRELYRPGGGDDEETYPLGTDTLDLEPLARDALLLGLPLAPLCREDCAGLCPTCGADLAEGGCGCARPPADARWAALDVLRSLND
ncbi:MAG: YceD family protein [Acidimicrobiales bacterium]